MSGQYQISDEELLRLAQLMGKVLNKEAMKNYFDWVLLEKNNQTDSPSL